MPAGDPPPARPRENTPYRQAVAWVRDNAEVDADGKPSPEDVANKAVRAVEALLGDTDEAARTRLLDLSQDLDESYDEAVVSVAQLIRLNGYRFDVAVISRVAVDAAKHFLGLQAASEAETTTA